MDKAQVKLVCASRVIGFGIPRPLSLLEERDFAVDTDSSDQRNYNAGHEILHR